MVAGPPRGYVKGVMPSSMYSGYAGSDERAVIPGDDTGWLCSSGLTRAEERVAIPGVSTGWLCSSRKGRGSPDPDEGLPDPTSRKACSFWDML